ncbi:MAG: TonB-dependent receptor [Prevotella sp.]|nr:TonB-dependent receptor [Prevotella sp.]
MKQVKFTLPLRMLALICGLILSASAFAQQITVNGHVKDSTGEPIIGATIRVVNDAAMAVTDFDGNFTIKAQQGAQLQVSYIGYQDAVATASPNVVITLQDDAQLLSDVVVIGYGRAKKEDLTGSVTAMKPDELSKGITNNASDMLVGKVAGVDVITAGGSPGAGAQIRIRGGASMSASNDPLYVVDGLTLDNNTASGMSNILAMINPNDIESFTILKDASATAIYGSRASNGVIIITTKKGREGQRAQVSYNGDVTLSTIAKKYDVLNGDEYRALIAGIDGLDATQLGDADTDWQDEIFRTTLSTTHSISVNGGLKNMPYRVSGGINIGNGIVTNNWMRRSNVSANLAPSLLNKHLNFNFTAKYMYEKDRYVSDGSAIGAALSMDPTRPVRGEGSDFGFSGGYWQYLINSSSISDPSWTKTVNPNAPQNPVALLNTERMIAQSHDFSGNAEVDYKIHGFEDLHLHGNIGAQYTATNQSTVYTPQSFNNNYYGWDGMNYNWKYNVVANAYAQYIHDFGSQSIDVMAGGEESHYHRSGYSFGSGWDGYLGEEHSPSTRADNEWRTHNALVSYFGRLNYNLLDRYLITGTFRADGSSRFADGHKWGYFPSAAFAWKINNEKFFRNATWLDEFKLRLGWGKTGQQNGIDDFYYAPLYVRSNAYAQYPFGNTYYYTTRPNRYNPDLTWEKTTTYNAGIDFTAYNGRFSVNLDGYYRKTTDLLATVKVPAMMNFSDQVLKNIGSLENYGVELAFDVKPIVTKDFTWDITYNVGWNHNEITELDAGAQDWVWTGPALGMSGNLQRNKVGQPVNSFYVFQQVYDEAGKPIEGLYVDRDADGQITDADRYYYKSPAADVIMGATTKFLYKNWDLSAAFHAAIGNYVYYDFLASRAPVGTALYSNANFHNTTPEAVALGFTGTSVTADYYKFSDYFVRNASYVKCSNITLGYTFPALLEYAGQKYFNGRIFLTVQNPFIISKYKGIDPEVASGYDSNPYPRPRSFQLGLNLNF